jgi:hypothetical protein
VTTSYYERHLAELHQRLLGHAVVQTYVVSKVSVEDPHG